METKILWTEEKIVHLLTNNNEAVARALVAIYNRQTQDEKSAENTHWRNNIGFSGADAHLGTYYAKWVLKGRQLSGKHLEKARQMALKYRRQLLSIANNG